MCCLIKCARPRPIGEVPMVPYNFPPTDRHQSSVTANDQLDRANQSISLEPFQLPMLLRIQIFSGSVLRYPPPENRQRASVFMVNVAFAKYQAASWAMNTPIGTSTHACTSSLGGSGNISKSFMRSASTCVIKSHLCYE